MDKGALNFRLLDILRILIAERHVSRAADRLDVSQPEMSRTLAKLRRITGDPLLLRTPHGMEPTDFAVRLAAHVDDFLLGWESLTQVEADFDISTCDQIFRVQAMDALIPLIIRPALHAMRLEAPRASISLSMPSLMTMREKLETGEVDVAIGILPELPQDLYVSKLMDCPWTCIVAADHPRVAGKLDIETFAQESHIVPTFGRASQLSLTERHVRNELAAHRLRRNVGAFVPAMLAIPGLVAESDMIGLVPVPVAEEAAKLLPIQLLAPPFAMPPHDLVLVWHTRTHNDPAHRWFRAILRGSGRAGGPP